MVNVTFFVYFFLFCQQMFMEKKYFILFFRAVVVLITMSNVFTFEFLFWKLDNVFLSNLIQFNVQTYKKIIKTLVITQYLFLHHAHLQLLAVIASSCSVQIFSASTWSYPALSPGHLCLSMMCLISMFLKAVWFTCLLNVVYIQGRLLPIGVYGLQVLGDAGSRPRHYFFLCDR